MQNNKYTRLIKDIIIFAIGTVLAKLVQFLLMPLYTTYMTTEAYGVAELTNNLAELLLPIVTLCIYEGAFRFIIELKFSKEEIFSASIKIIFLSALIGSLILMFFQFVIQYEYALYLYIILYAYSLKMLVGYYVRGKGKSKTFAMSGIINAISLALLSIIFLIFLELDVKGYLLAIAGSYICSTAFLMLFGNVYKDFKFNVKTKIVTKEMLHYCLPLIIYNIGYWLTTMSGRYILLWNTNASNAGMYAAVIKISSVINMMQQAFYSAFQLNNSREYQEKDKEKYFSNSFNLYATGNLIFGSIIICMSPVLATLTLKNEFFEARVYLPLIIFVAIIDCMFCFFKTMYTTYKYTKKAIPSMLIGASVNVFFCLITVKKFEIWGICYASLLCYISQAIYRIIDTKKFVSIECNWKKIFICLILLYTQVICVSKYSIKTNIISIIICLTIIIINLVTNRELLKLIKDKIKDLCKNF